MGTKTSSGIELAPIAWRDPIDDGLTVIELTDQEAEAQWMAAFHSMYLSKEERHYAPTVSSPLS